MKPNQTISVILLAAAGCSQTSSMTEDQFCQEYAKRECAKVATYCSFTPSVCEPVRVTACKTMSASQVTATRKFNAGNTKRCLDQVDAAYASLPVTADRLNALDAACARVFVGTAKANESCTVDFDCDGDQICDKGRCGTKKVVAAGGGCANVGETCPAGEYCTNTSGLYTCTKRQASGATCSATQPCTETLRCNGTCSARAGNLTNCTSDDECMSGYCNPYPAPGTPKKCSVGLTFSDGSASCTAFTDPNATPATDAGSSSDL
jgi:hypothetical protein